MDEKENRVKFVMRFYFDKESWFDLHLGYTPSEAAYNLGKVHYDVENMRMYPTTTRCLSWFGIYNEFDLDKPLMIDLICVYERNGVSTDRIQFPITALRYNRDLWNYGFCLLEAAMLMNRETVYDDVLKL